MPRWNDPKTIGANTQEAKQARAAGKLPDGLSYAVDKARYDEKPGKAAAQEESAAALRAAEETAAAVVKNKGR
jgi:hypothetical protein